MHVIRSCPPASRSRALSDVCGCIACAGAGCLRGKRAAAIEPAPASRSGSACDLLRAQSPTLLARVTCTSTSASSSPTRSCQSFSVSWPLAGRRREFGHLQLAGPRRRCDPRDPARRGGAPIEHPRIRVVRRRSPLPAPGSAASAYVSSAARGRRRVARRGTADQQRQRQPRRRAPDARRHSTGPAAAGAPPSTRAATGATGPGPAAASAAPGAAPTRCSSRSSSRRQPSHASRCSRGRAVPGSTPGSRSASSCPS